MAYDNNGNWVEDEPVGPFKPSQQQWDEASNTLNKYISGSNPGASINWEKARAEFEKNAASGGNFGDWVNKTMDARNSWLNSSAPNINPNSGIAGNQQGRYDYEALRSAWLAPGFNTTVQGGQQALADFIKNNPQFATGVTVRNDAIFDPSGKFIADLIGDVGGKNSRIFLRGSANNTTKTPPKTTTPPGTTFVDSGHGPKDGLPGLGGPTSPPPPSNLPPSTGGPGGPGSSVAPVQDPRLTELYNTLLERSKQGLAVDRNNPVIRQQSDAYAAQQERARRNYLSDLAESAGPNANLRGEQRMAAERAGQATSAFEAELMGREITAKRDEIQNALTQMQGLLTTEQEAALRKELALMDDAVKRLQISTQNSQFYADLAFRGKQLTQQQKEFAETMKYKYAELSQQQKQFMEEMGYKWNGRMWEQNPANPANRV